MSGMLGNVLPSTGTSNTARTPSAATPTETKGKPSSTGAVVNGSAQPTRGGLKTSGITPIPAPPPVKKPNPTLQTLLEASQEFKKGEVTPQVRTVCSAVDSHGTPILKFSELFVPSIPVDAFLPQKRPKTQSQLNLEELCEADEHFLFEEVEEEDEDQQGSDRFWRQRQLAENNQPLSSDGATAVVGQPLKEHPVEDTEQLLHKLPEAAFDTLQQISWEDRIMWDDTDTKEGGQGDVEMRDVGHVQLSSFITPFNNNESADARPLWGKVQAISAPQNSAKQQGAKIQLHKEDVVMTDASTSSLTSSLPSKPLSEIFTHVNTELERGDWTDAIIWDDDAPPTSTLHTQLILDLNDKNAFPDDPSKSLIVQTQPSASAMDETRRRIMLARKRKASDLAASTPGAPASASNLEEQEMDQFNLSNDQHYRESAFGSKTLQKLAKQKVIHSEPALKLSLVKPVLTKDDLNNFHRPKLKLAPGEVVKMQPLKKVLQCHRPTKTYWCGLLAWRANAYYLQCRTSCSMVTNGHRKAQRDLLRPQHWTLCS
jgi:hypothetical protein